MSAHCLRLSDELDERKTTGASQANSHEDTFQTQDHGGGFNSFVLYDSIQVNLVSTPGMLWATGLVHC